MFKRTGFPILNLKGVITIQKHHFFTKPRGYIILGIIFLLLLALGGWFWQRKSAMGEGDFISVPTAAGNLVATISASGMIEPVQSLNLSFKNPGTVIVVAVEQGQEVKKGQLLLAQDDRDQQAQVVSARANLRSAQARLEELVNGNRPEDIASARAEEAGGRVAKDTASTQLERVKALHEQGAATQKELDDAQNNYASVLARWEQAKSRLKLMEEGTRPEQIEQAKATVNTAEVQLALAENNLEAMRLSAPFNGIVAEVNATVGQRVTGVTVSGTDNSARPLLSVVSQKLRARAQVNEADIGQVAPGQQATFVVNAFPERKFSARATAVAPQAITVNNIQFYDVILEIVGNPAGLKAGMPCNLEIVKANRDNVLTVPRQALSFARSYATAQNLQLPTGSRSRSMVNRGAVLVLKNGRVELRPIELGISSNEMVEVAAGLAQGEQVVTGQKNALTGGSAARSPFMPTGPQGGGGRR
jgi:HlyD family secretion protein